MRYVVEVTATAEYEAEAAFHWLSERTSVRAVRWIDRLHDAIKRTG